MLKYYNSYTSKFNKENALFTAIVYLNDHIKWFIIPVSLTGIAGVRTTDKSPFLLPDMRSRRKRCWESITLVTAFVMKQYFKFGSL